MNDKILDSLMEKYGLEFWDNEEIEDKPQQMTEVNKLRFQNITYKAAKSKFEAWRMRRGIKARIKQKMESYEETVRESKREELSAEIAILMSKYKFLKTNEGESPEIISRRAIRLNDGMIDNAHGKVNVILRELDREADKEKITNRNVGTISKEDREELEAEIEKARLKNDDSFEEDLPSMPVEEEPEEDELAAEEIISEIEEDPEEKEDASDISNAEEMELDLDDEKNKVDSKLVISAEDIRKYKEQKNEKDQMLEDTDLKNDKEPDKTVLKVSLAQVEEYNKSLKDKEEPKKTVLRIPLKEVEEYNKPKEDKGIIAKGMTDEEIEESRKLLEETAPRAKDATVPKIKFKAKMPRERNEGETTKEYGQYLDEFYKNLREDYYKSLSGKKDDHVEAKEEPSKEKTERDYREEINRLKELGARLREQSKATKEAKRRQDQSVEEAAKAAEEKRRIEKEEVEKAEKEKAQAEELRRKKQEAMELVIEEFKKYLDGMKKEIEETEEDIRNAKEKEQQIRDESEKETAKNNERKAAAYRDRDEANQIISSQDEYINEMLSSMNKEPAPESKKNK